MINRLIRWAVHNRLVVILLASGLLGYGIYAFREVDVEAYPDPAPAVVEVVARFPGASAEEVERQVTIPLEVALAGMPGLTITRTQSLFELCHISNQFEYGVDQQAARQEILNRLQMAQLPAGVVRISPRGRPPGEIFRYVLVGPKDSAGRDIYDPNDLKSLQDSTLERLFRRIPRVVDVTSYGGTVKRYEIHPDPARMQRVRHHLAAAQRRDRLEQFQRRGRLHHPGRRRPRGPLAGTVGHGPRPHGNRDGHERPRRRTQLPAGRGRTSHPRDPPDRAQRHEQRAGARRRRGRRRTAAGRFAVRKAGRGDGPPDPSRTRDAERRARRWGTRRVPTCGSGSGPRRGRRYSVLRVKAGAFGTTKTKSSRASSCSARATNRCPPWPTSTPWSSNSMNLLVACCRA